MAERRYGAVDPTRRGWDHACTGACSCTWGICVEPSDESGGLDATGAGRSGIALGACRPCDGKAAGRVCKLDSEMGWLCVIQILFDDAGDILIEADEICLYVARCSPCRSLGGGDESLVEPARVARILFLYAAGDDSREHAIDGEILRFRCNACEIIGDIGTDFWLDSRQGVIDDTDVA